MTTGQWIVVALFIVALLCSLSLYLWLRRIVRRDRHLDVDAAIDDSARKPPEPS
ncbi:MAG TPA: hypothetical protein VK104_06975 [Burkholderiaceae bacterium]|nr:hypothetical protein [Burkholderiaceae bacterium]